MISTYVRLLSLYAMGDAAAGLGCRCTFVYGRWLVCWRSRVRWEYAKRKARNPGMTPKCPRRGAFNLAQEVVTYHSPESPAHGHTSALLLLRLRCLHAVYISHGRGDRPQRKSKQSRASHFTFGLV